VNLKCTEKSGLEDAPAAQGCTRQATALAGSNKLSRSPLPYLALPRLIVVLIVVVFCLLPHVRDDTEGLIRPFLLDWFLTPTSRTRGPLSRAFSGLTATNTLTLELWYSRVNRCVLEATGA